jgi:hypothetical protein
LLKVQFVQWKKAVSAVQDNILTKYKAKAGSDHIRPAFLHLDNSS